MTGPRANVPRGRNPPARPLARKRTFLKTTPAYLSMAGLSFTGSCRSTGHLFPVGEEPIRPLVWNNVRDEVNLGGISAPLHPYAIGSPSMR